MAELVAYFQTASGAPLTGPAGANIPEITITRTPADTVAQAAIDMAELANAPGWYAFTFAPVDGTEYVWIADGDPAVAGQVPATARYVFGAISGTTVARSEVDVPAILVDTDALELRLTALRAANLDELTAIRMAELDAANLPADVDTLLARLTALRAANLDEITAARLSELDGANIPADVDTLLARLTALRAAALDEITAIRMAELDAANLPADVDTLLLRLTALRAANLDEITAARLAELDPANLPADVALVLSTGGAGPWTTGAGVADWTPAEREQIRDGIGVDGTKTAAVGGQLQAVAADAASLDDVKITAPRAANLDEITAARLAELDAANLPADVDAIGTGVATVVLRTVDLDAAIAFLGAVLGTPVTHTPTSVVAGGFTWTVGVVGSTVTITRTA